MHSIAQIGAHLPQRRAEVGGIVNDVIDGFRRFVGADQQPAPAPMPYPFPMQAPEKDNTALYIGGAAVLVVLILVMTQK